MGSPRVMGGSQSSYARFAGLMYLFTAFDVAGVVILSRIPRALGCARLSVLHGRLCWKPSPAAVFGCAPRYWRPADRDSGACPRSVAVDSGDQHTDARIARRWARRDGGLTTSSAPVKVRFLTMTSASISTVSELEDGLCRSTRRTGRLSPRRVPQASRQLSPRRYRSWSGWGL